MVHKCEYTAFVDGASSGNPGDSGIGIVIYKDKEEIVRESRYIGQQTNNVAEYTALLVLLEMLEKHGIKQIKIFSDSELMVKQMSGEYKIKNDALRILAVKAQSHRKKIKFTLEHIRREGNAEADDLAKSASKRGGKINDV
jgi:ribonuclease HI